MKKIIPNPKKNEAACTELDGIVRGNEMEGWGIDGKEIIVCPLIEVAKGNGSLFQTAYLDSEGRIFAHTLYGRSDHLIGRWVLARDNIFEVTPKDEFYQNYRRLLTEEGAA